MNVCSIDIDERIDLGYCRNTPTQKSLLCLPDNRRIDRLVQSFVRCRYIN